MRAGALTWRISGPAGFLVVAACFLLPFVTVSCTPASPGIGGMTATYSGADLVLGRRADLTASPQLLARMGPSPHIDGGPLPTLAQTHDQYMQPIPVQPFLIVTLILLGLGIAAGAIPRPWPRALAESSLALGAVLFLASGEYLARHAALARVTADATPVFGSLSGPQSANSATLIEPHSGFGFWLGLSLLVLIAAASIARLVRLSTKPVAAAVAQPP
jgi:hypothetical protein